MKPIHIGIAGPIHLPSLQSIILEPTEKYPIGMGGVPVNHLIISLFNQGHKVSVYSSSTEIEPGKSFELHQENLSIYIGPYRKRIFSRMIDFFKVEKRYITDIIKKTQPDLVHAHWQYEWAWASLNSGIRTLVTCHDSPLNVLAAQRDLYRLFRLIVATIVLRKAKYLTSVSPYCAAGLKIFTKRHIEIIPNFEPDFVYSLYDCNKTLGTPLKIAMINNGFSDRKNVQKGIEAFLEYVKRNPNSELNLYGIDYGENDKAKRWCIENNLPLENIKFNGELTFHNLMLRLSTMDILLHTSIEESFGMILIEAMAIGIPVIAGLRSGGPDWILKDGGGLLVDVRDTKSIVSALQILGEPRTYQIHSETARKVAIDRFSQKKVVQNYLETYKKIIQEAS